MTSTALAPAHELLPVPPAGRRYVGHATVRLGDADRRGEARLDAVARYLQDVANDDALDAGLDNAMGWVVRRTLIRLDQPAQLGERLTATTFCSGTGRSWAERRTSIVGDAGASIEAVSLWVQVHPTSGRPTRLGDSFHRVYGEAGGGRVVSSRLALGPPPDGAERRPWPVRVSDLDVFGHANNAAQWAVLEEAMAGVRGRRGTAEIEYPGAVDAGAVIEAHLVNGEQTAAWLVELGVVRCASRWTPAAVA